MPSALQETHCAQSRYKGPDKSRAKEKTCLTFLQLFLKCMQPQTVVVVVVLKITFTSKATAFDGAWKRGFDSGGIA